MTERRELLTLSREESLALLATAWIGRVILTANAMPTALPVNFAVDDEGGIVFRSAEGMKLAAARSGTVVAFEADQFDPQLKMGWSVLVTGVARQIVDSGELARAQGLNIPAWVDAGADQQYARIEPGVVSGRRLVPSVAGLTG
jgi:nitroimidazol reductase NimA-like FMN-containing flavoprotein (pyridoxamine 5'-phosphate oxidase superfamily)